VARHRKKLVLLPDHVVRTIDTLHDRIRERFPNAGLGRVCAQLAEIARLDVKRAAGLGRRYIWLRLFIILALALGGWVVWQLVSLFNITTTTADLSAVLQGIEAATNLAILTGAAIIFLLRLEASLKRGRALGALHELRSVVHVIDMHQLTKDPSKFIVGGSTKSSPPLQLNEFQMTRYLEYCTEMLSLTSKVAVLFGQNLDDPAVAEVVSDIERIGAGLSEKIWQKIVILQQFRATEAAMPPLFGAGKSTAD
jgi:hypothetical protein